jgi:hypothetical protein
MRIKSLKRFKTISNPNEIRHTKSIIFGPEILDDLKKYILNKGIDIIAYTKTVLRISARRAPLDQ